MSAPATPVQPEKPKERDQPDLPLPGGSEGPKEERVRQMFSDIAPTYDLLNRLLSFGVDQRWRARAARQVLQPFQAMPNPQVLDVACGTGDLSFALKKHMPNATVTGADFAEPMLEIARTKAEKRGMDIAFLQADGTNLPFDDAQFDAVTIAYGLRNFADPQAGLNEFRRVLKPGGRLAVLEFPPPPKGLLGSPFRFYFRQLLPQLGGFISGKKSAYSYLPESVFAFFEPQQLDDRLRQAGFSRVSHKLQTFGVSALHLADASATKGAE